MPVAEELVTKAPELTAAQLTKLMTLYYVDVKQKLTGTSSTNVAVWESLTAMFNSWCDPLPTFQTLRKAHWFII